MFRQELVALHVQMKETFVFSNTSIPISFFSLEDKEIRFVASSKGMFFFVEYINQTWSKYEQDQKHIIITNCFFAPETPLYKLLIFLLIVKRQINVPFEKLL
jgi:hypothetical protein